ncbi:MAG: ribosome-binding factor A [Rhodobacteraceae bacterium]|nr:ribosome-binding factor A [Paracoccaceae bacterium]
MPGRRSISLLVNRGFPMSKRRYQSRNPSQRQLRVGELVRRNLARILAELPIGDGDSPAPPLTVGEVKMSPDLKRATVFVLPLGGRNTEASLEALNERRREIRRILNRSLRLKFSPALEFVPDPVFDQMDEMQRLFNLESVRQDIDATRTEEDKRLDE